jgi:hypothetical protein
VAYISVAGMLEAYEKSGLPESSLCTYCIGGRHPFAGCEAHVAPKVAAVQLSLLGRDQ